jgi:hypothetical protein
VVLILPDEEVQEYGQEGEGRKDSGGGKLNASIRTIEGRRHEVFEKMGVESVAALVRLVIEGQLAE